MKKVTYCQGQEDQKQCTLCKDQNKCKLKKTKHKISCNYYHLWENKVKERNKQVAKHWKLQQDKKPY